MIFFRLIRPNFISKTRQKLLQKKLGWSNQIGLINMKYKELVIYYFSGTGNAKRTANWIKEEAEKANLNVRIENIVQLKNKVIEKPDKNSLIGFISPTHGFHFPEIMRKFIRLFPKANNCSAFIMNTRAGIRIGSKTLRGISGVLHGWSSMVLHRKGYRITGLFPVDLPSNWISLHPAIGKKGTDIIFRTIEPKVRHFASDMIQGKRNYKGLSISNLITDTLISPISVLYMLFGRYFFAKSFIASSKCDMCGLCERTCPVGAIKRVDNRMFWTHKCESCMKCMNSCPQKAIETAHGFLFITWIITSVIVGFVFNLLANISEIENMHWLQNGNLESLLSWLLVFPILFLGYRITHWLMRFKLFERFFVLTALTHYKFWGRYKSPRKQ